MQVAPYLRFPTGHQGLPVQDQPNDEFSFKGVAPDDRVTPEQGIGSGPADADAANSIEAEAEVAHPAPEAPLPAPVAEAGDVNLANATAVEGEAHVVADQEAQLSVPAPAMAGTAAGGARAEGPAGPGSPAGPGAAAGSAGPSSPTGTAHQSPSADPYAAGVQARIAQGGGAPSGGAPVGAGGSSADPMLAGQVNPGVTPQRPKVTIEKANDRAPAGKTVNPRQLIQGWLAQMVAAKASDLILRSGGRPSQRLDGKIGFLPGTVPGPGPMLEVLRGILGDKRMATFEQTGAADAALDLDGLGRFRINAYKQMGEPAIVIRRINESAPSLEDLNLPVDALRDLAMRKRGLVLVTGVAGSGKSTTLSAMIEFMNRNVERHVVTLEDPVELMFKERYCVISQREVGTDTTSFKQGIKHALRQSPDVIFIGEMRDAETVLAALEAIETGHLVMSTMHTVNAAQTVDRILGFFPAERHVQIRQRMADTLAGVLSMRLVPRIGGGQVPAFELMQVTPQVRELLEEGKTTELGRVIQGGAEAGIVSFNDRLFELVNTGLVELDDAIQTSDRPDELIMMVRGIQGGQRASAKASAQSAADGKDSLGQPKRRNSDRDAAERPQNGAAPPAEGGQRSSGGSNLRLRGNNGH